jgi:hypothetical protein
MGEWKAQISIRVRRDLRVEMEKFAVRERRKPGNIGEVLLEWAFEQLKAASRSGTDRLVSVLSACTSGPPQLRLLNFLSVFYVPILLDSIKQFFRRFERAAVGFGKFEFRWHEFTTQRNPQQPFASNPKHLTKIRVSN